MRYLAINSDTAGGYKTHIHHWGMYDLRGHFLQLQHRSISALLLRHPVLLFKGPLLMSGTKGPKEVEIQWHGNTRSFFCRRKAQRKVEGQWSTGIPPSHL